MSDDDNEKGVGVAGGIGSVAVGAAVTGGAAVGLASHRLGKLPEAAKNYLTPEKVEAVEKQAAESFMPKMPKEAEKAEDYFKAIEAEAAKGKGKLKITRGMSEKELTNALKAKKLDAHMEGALKEFIKKDSKPEAILEAGKKAHSEAFTADYAKTVAAKAKALGLDSKTKADDVVKKLEAAKLSPPMEAAVKEHIKEGSKIEAVVEAGKKAHIEAKVAVHEKSVLDSIKTQITDAAKAAKKDAPNAEALTKEAESMLKGAKGYVKAGSMGKPWAAFKGLGTGGKISTVLGGVAAAILTGMAISSMRGGSHVEQLQQSRDNGQSAPARA